MSTTSTSDPLRTRQETADILGVSLRSVDRLLADGRLIPTRLPGIRGTKFRQSRIDALLAEADGETIAKGLDRR